MAKTVVPSDGAAETFEHAFNRAVLQSERLRLSVVILMLLAIMLRWLFVWLFMPGVLAGQLGGALNLAALGILGLVALVYELAVLGRVFLALRRDWPIPRVLRFVNALVEISVPSLAVIVGPEVTSPAYALDMPPV